VHLHVLSWYFPKNLTS